MKKRMIAALTLLVLVLSLGASAMAATVKPTAVLTNSPSTVTRGKTYHFVMRLDSRDYPAKNDTFRAKVVSKISKGTQETGNAAWLWTGKMYYRLRVKFKKAAPVGKYKLSYTTYYRKNASSSWKKNKTKTKTFTVK